MDLTTIDDEEDVEATEDIISFHSNVRENIVRRIFTVLSHLDIWVIRPLLKSYHKPNNFAYKKKLFHLSYVKYTSVNLFGYFDFNSYSLIRPKNRLITF
jgi:hypothetical protein